MTPAELARQNAIPLELKKDGLFQRQSGDWVLRFVVQASDMNERLMKAAMGTRFQAALVEVNDDESPVQQPALASAKPSAQPGKELPASEPHSGRASWPAEPKSHVGWKDLQPAAQAGIRCEEPTFFHFLIENYRGAWLDSKGNAPECVRRICCIDSRSELSTNHKARMIWKAVDDQYQAWKALERC